MALAGAIVAFLLVRGLIDGRGVERVAAMIRELGRN